MDQIPAWKVLIIEDERIDREIYKRYLQYAPGLRFEFAEADCAASGIEMSGQWRPDCILLDFNLPDMDGLAVLPRLRAGNDRLPCAVVMLTAFGGEELAVNAMKNGAMDYLPKGQVSAGVLPRAVVNAMERFQLQQHVDQQRAELERSTLRYQALLAAIPQMVWTADAEGRLEYANQQWRDYTGLGAPHPDQFEWDVLLHPDDAPRTRDAWREARRGGSILEIEHRLKRAADGIYRWHLVRAVPFRSAAGEIVSWFGTSTDIEKQKQAEILNLEREKLEAIGRLAAGVAHGFNNLLVGILGGASLSMELLPPAHPAQELLAEVLKAGERAAELTSKILAYSGKGNLFVERAELNELVQETCESLRPSISAAIRLKVIAGPEILPVTTDVGQLRQAIVSLVRNAAEAIPEGSSGRISVRTGMQTMGEGSAAGNYAVLEVEDSGCGMDEETQKNIFDPYFSTKFTGRGLALAALNGFVRSNGGDVQVESAPGCGTRFRILLPLTPVSVNAAD